MPIEPPPKVNPSFEQLLQQTQVIVRPPKREQLRRLRQLERAKAKLENQQGAQREKKRIRST
jgi:hypothetical protein